MSRVALKGLLFRRSRTILTAIAIVLGVAMVSGTYVLTDTITKAFDGIFTASYEQTSAVITGKSVVTESSGQRDHPRVPGRRGCGSCRGSPTRRARSSTSRAPPTRRS